MCDNCVNKKESLEGKNIIVFDLEIQKEIVTDDSEIDPEYQVRGWGEKAKTLVSVAYIYDYLIGKYVSYDQWTLLPLAKRIKEADIVVGHNHINFDYPVLNGHIEIVFGDTASKYTIASSPVRDFDIMMEIKKANGNKWGGKGNFTLGSIGEKTCGVGKSGDGGNAPMLWREGKYAELYNYCCADVELTKKVYENIYYKGFAIDGSGTKFEIPTF